MNPLLLLPPETAHSIGIKLLKTGLILPSPPDHSDLQTKTLGHTFSNPLGIAAGFDKNAEVISSLFKMGFGYVETGTVTPKPQPGNPKPRIFRDTKNKAVINRMGFPGAGVEIFKKNLGNFLEQRTDPKQIVGVNIGKNKDTEDFTKDYTNLISNINTMADYFAINISSPNTPGLRDIQTPEKIRQLLEEAQNTRDRTCTGKNPPILIKLAPDLNKEQQEQIAESLIQAKVEGIILANTTLDRPKELNSSFAKQTGGLSGRPLKEKTRTLVQNFHRLTKGQIPIIGAGGIENGEDATHMLSSGANLIQVYTSFIYQGPDLIKQIKQHLLKNKTP